MKYIITTTIADEGIRHIYKSERTKSNEKPEDEKIRISEFPGDIQRALEFYAELHRDIINNTNLMTRGSFFSQLEGSIVI